MVRPSTKTSRNRPAEEADRNRALLAEYRLNVTPCKPSECSSKTCRGNPLCLGRLGQEKWTSIVAKAEADKDKDGVVSRAADQPAGIKNEGNTCYLNSFLQQLYNDAHLRSVLYNWRADEAWARRPNAEHDGLVNIEQVMGALQNIFVQLQHTPYMYVEAKDLIASLYLDTEQQDVHEFWMLFSDMLADRLLAHPNGQAAVRLLHNRYKGTLTRSTRCAGPGCAYVRPVDEDFRVLQLSVEGRPDLTDALTTVFADDTVERTCARAEGGCGHVGARIECQFKRLPHVLMLQLNRFIFDPTSGRRRKDQTPIAYPRRLDLSPFVSDARGQRCQFRLTGVLVHVGKSDRAGHYYALIREAGGGGRWHKYNDTAVTPLADEKQPGVDDVAKALAAAKKVSREDAKNAYMLFYEAVGEENDQLPVAAPDVMDSIIAPLQRRFHDVQQRDDRLRERRVTLATAKQMRLDRLWDTMTVSSRLSPERLLDDCAFVPGQLLRAIQKYEADAIAALYKHDDTMSSSWSETTSAVTLAQSKSESDTTSSSSSLEEQPISSGYLAPQLVVDMCPHDRLSPSAVNKGTVRVVRNEGLSLLVDMYNLQPVVDTQLRSLLCERCVFKDDSSDGPDDQLQLVCDMLRDEPQPRRTDNVHPEQLSSMYWVTSAVLTAGRLRQLTKPTTNNTKSANQMAWFATVDTSTTDTENGAAAASATEPNDDDASDNIASEPDTKRPKTAKADEPQTNGQSALTNGCSEEEEQQQSTSNQPDDVSAEPDEPSASVSGESSSSADGGGGGGGQHPLLTAVVCPPHGLLQPQRGKRCLVGEECWLALCQLLDHCPQLALSGEADVCEQCDAQTQEVNSALSKQRELASSLAKQLSRTVNAWPERCLRTATAALLPETYVVVCTAFVKQLYQFIKSKGEDGAAPAVVCNACVVCRVPDHQPADANALRLNVQLTQLMQQPAAMVQFALALTYLTQEEYAKIDACLGGRLRIDQRINVVFSETSLLARLDLPDCPHCAHEADNSKYVYRDAPITIKVVRDDISLKSAMEAALLYAEQSSQDTAGSCELGLRRSHRTATRTTRQNSGDRDLRVDSTTTVMQLKLKLMEVHHFMPNDQRLFHGTDELTDSQRTLADYRIPASGSVIALLPDVLQARHADVEAEQEKQTAVPQAPERGFGLTGLRGR